VFVRGEDKLDKFDWEAAEEGTPLWVVYCFNLKSYAAAAGFRVIGFMPLLDNGVCEKISSTTSGVPCSITVYAR